MSVRGGIVIQHTFGGRLNYHPYLHLMVSAGGLKPDEGRLKPSRAAQGLKS